MRGIVIWSGFKAMGKQRRIVSRPLFLARDTRDNKQALTQLRREINELATVVEKISSKL